jgi:glutamine---fructose-6-phosphate transaminase (isomerizing)
MCGIFGVVALCRTTEERRVAGALLRRIAVRSQTRGRDSSGFAVHCGGSTPTRVLRAPMTMSRLVRSAPFESLVAGTIGNAALQPAGGGPSLVAAIGHSRLVTNGTQLADHNNQPVVRSGVVGVHNGIVVNEDELWARTGERRQFDIDTEALLALFAARLCQGDDSLEAIGALQRIVRGSFSVALLPSDRAELVLATNNGSLYLTWVDGVVLVFASERAMLQDLQKAGTDPRLAGRPIEQVHAGAGLVVDLRTLDIERATAGQPARRQKPAAPVTPSPIEVTGLPAKQGHRSLLVDFRTIVSDPGAPAARRLLEFDLARLRSLKRCSRCVLPETFPFIAFDEQGVCNYCRHYRPRNLTGSLDELRRIVEPYRRSDGSQDCIVPFSGGRDSTFALHMLKRELGMNPIALTYDWGMVTDLARRNIARVCGKLGVENVIAAANIEWKRDNIRKNIAAWLKRPSLGMIPLFMSGDKYFFYHTNKLKRQTGISLNVWGINRLENTDFKTGFAGVPPRFDKRRIYSMSLAGHLRFWGYVASNVALNPALINSSNLDSIGSIFSRYLFPQRDYHSFFDFYPWNEQEIEGLITREYDWERAIDTESTWRIGDGTASFYNYVYTTVAGFSENDTFRSNQIREGLISREVALRKVEQENAPRYENIRWYLEIVGLDYEPTIRRINAIPRLDRAS